MFGHRKIGEDLCESQMFTGFFQRLSACSNTSSPASSRLVDLCLLPEWLDSVWDLFVSASQTSPGTTNRSACLLQKQTTPLHIQQSKMLFRQLSRHLMEAHHTSLSHENNAQVA